MSALRLPLAVSDSGAIVNSVGAAVVYATGVHRADADAIVAAINTNAETVAGLQAALREVEGKAARLSRTLFAITQDVRAWDLASDAYGEGFRDIVPRPFGPNRKASDRCESGKREYCTCSTCF